MIEFSLATETIRTVARIVQLLQQETAMLNAMKPQEVAELQSRKAALVTEYEERLAALGRTPEVAAALAPALRQELAHAAETLKAAIADNHRALTAARLAVDQLVQSIAAAVTEEQRVQELYRADGRSGHRTTAAAPVAVSVNQVL